MDAGSECQSKRHNCSVDITFMGSRGVRLTFVDSAEDNHKLEVSSGFYT